MGLVDDLIGEGLTGDDLLHAVMQKTGMGEDNARDMIAIDTGESDGDVVFIPDEAAVDA